MRFRLFLAIFLIFYLSLLGVAQEKKSDDILEFNFSNFEIRNLIDVISKLTNKTILFEERDIVGKKVSLISPGKYSEKEAFAIFEAILDVNNLTTVKYDNFIRIVNKNNAKRTQTPITSEEENTYSFITRIIKLEHINVNTARATITPLISPSTTLVQYAPSNILIIRDTAESSEKIIDLLKRIDTESPRVRVAKIHIEYAELNQTIQFVTRIMSQQNKQKQSQPPIIIPDQVSNSIIIAGSLDDIKSIKAIISEIDVGQEAIKLQIFQIKQAKATEMAKILSSIFSVGKQSSINIIPDVTFNRLIITAREATLNKIKSLINELDKSVQSDKSEYRVFRLNNANAKEIAPVLQQATRSISLIARSAENNGDPKQQNNQVRTQQLNPSSLNSSISIIADDATNSLVVYAQSSEFPVIEKVIGDLDIVRPQVFVEALIMEISLEKSLNLGVDWKASGTIEQNGNVEAVGTISNARPANPSTFASAASVAPEGTSVGILGKGIPFGDQNFSSFSAFVQATQTDSDINILSNPKILTLNNKEAEIRVGEVRPFQTALKIDSNGAESRSFEYKEVGVVLKIIPQINPDGSIKLSINQSTKEIRQSTESSQQSFTPTTLERSLKSDVIVADSEIVALGGLINDKIDNFETKTPCLGDIPLLGWLFKSTSTRNSKTNLLVFIAPKIVRNNEDSFSQTEKAKNDFHNASNDRFRIDISDELDLPSVKITDGDKEQRTKKEFQYRAPNSPQNNPSSFFYSYGEQTSSEEPMPTKDQTSDEAEVQPLEFNSGEIKSVSPAPNPNPVPNNAPQPQAPQKQN